MEILYIDQWLIVINKPAGLLSIQDGYDKTAPHVRTILEPEFGRCWIVHRLDKDTSGTLILARTKEMHRALSILFEMRQIKKKYLAVVFGIPSEEEFEINLPLRVNADRHHRTRVDINKGKEARTKVKILKCFENLSLLEVMPLTGYTHQIRAHLAYYDLPIVGDLLYGTLLKTQSTKRLVTVPHLALHSTSLDFIHPVTQKQITIISDPPLFFEDLLK